MAETESSLNLMLLPTLACPASCAYCFGPHAGGTTMLSETLEAVIHWQAEAGSQQPLAITFHGGEPLVPGEDFYRMALPKLREQLAPRQVRFSVQSNLWLLTDDLCKLFREYHVSLGTSLDGPESINDAQRGLGYFQKTMAGIQRAHAYGLAVGCICTFTNQSVDKAGEIFEFFLQKKLGFSIHAALPPLGRSDGFHTLSPQAHGQLLVDMLGRYLENTATIRVSTLDALARSISAGKGGICTFTDCLGKYLAIDPDGWIYPCQRMAGMAAYQLGNVHECPSMDDLKDTAIWQSLARRQERIREVCADCQHLPYCQGGCPYNVLAANHGSLDGDPRDPHCPAYQQALDAITTRAMQEVFSEQNLSVVAEGRQAKYGFLQKGALVEIMRDSPHPTEIASRARQVAAAAALGVCSSPEDARRRLDLAGVITNPDAALGSLRALRDYLDTQSQQHLVNAYLHVTDACNLSCRHCYAFSKEPEVASSMAVGDFAVLIREAAAAGFSKAVITGGEPLMHPNKQTLLDMLADLRGEVQPMRIALRTNLAYRLDEALMERLFCATDEIVVSLDGDRESHNEQRGVGTYSQTVENLRALVRQKAQQDLIARESRLPAARIRIAATLPFPMIEGPQGDAVRALGQELDLPVRFKPILPLGRGKELGLSPAFYSSLDDNVDSMVDGARPAATCGLGMNLYVGADGSCYPCYALMGKRHDLGNALRDGLACILEKNDAYRQVTVDSNRGCRVCALRYLCGGFCQAWGLDDEDAPPTDCAALYARAAHILHTAFEILEIDSKLWRAAGLPGINGKIT